MSLRERLETIRTSPLPSNEETAKNRILNPILQSLGWDPFGQEVLRQHPIDGKDSGGRVDIALKSAGRVVAFIEVKAPGANLNNCVTQILGDSTRAGVKICVLTTGLEWWLYLPREQGQPQERRFSVLKLMDNPLQQLMEELGAYLSKDALVSGRAERRAKAIREARLEVVRLNVEVPKIWQEMLSRPDNELVELLRLRVYQRLNLRPNKDQLVAILKGKDVSSIPTPERVATNALSPKKFTIAHSLYQNQAPYAIELWGQRHRVSTYVAAFKTIIDKLYERHQSEFHITLRNYGRDYPYAARNPNDLGPTGSRRYYEPRGSGYFFNVNFSAADLAKRWGEYLYLFGYNSDEAIVIYE